MITRRSKIHRLVVEELASHENLSEGIVGDVSRNIVTSAISAAAEYGLAATVAGAPAAPVAETAVDAAASGQRITSTISTLHGIAKSGSELSTLFDAAAGALKGEFNSETLYLAVKKALAAMLASGGGALIDKVKAKIEEILGKISGVVGDAIKLLVPDAAVGFVASSAVTAVTTLASNTYTVLAAAINQLGDLKDYLTVPGKAANFFKEAIPELVGLLQKVAEKLEGSSNVKAFMLGGGAGLVLKNAGPAGLRKVADAITSQTPMIVSLLSSIVSIMVPTLLAAAAAIQSIISGDYKKADGGKAAPGAAADKVQDAAAQVNEVQMRLTELRIRRARRSGSRMRFATS